MLHRVPHGDNLLTDQRDLAITGDRRQQTFRADRCGKLEFQQRRRAIQFHSFDACDAFEIAVLRWVRSAKVSFALHCHKGSLPLPPVDLSIRPAQGFVGLNRIGERRELVLFLRAL
jgi:hypothetical protein